LDCSRAFSPVISASATCDTVPLALIAVKTCARQPPVLDQFDM
jgi:hypothetical protein